MAKLHVVEIPLCVNNQAIGQIKVDPSGRIKFDVTEFLNPRDIHQVLNSLKDLACSLAVAPPD